MAKRTVKLCKEKDCKNQATTTGYCRLHYLRNWKKIRDKQKKKAVQSLNKYVEFIMKRNPDNFVQSIKHDMRNPERFQTRVKDFADTDESYYRVMDDLEVSTEVEKIIDGIKIDETF